MNLSLFQCFAFYILQCSGISSYNFRRESDMKYSTWTSTVTRVSPVQCCARCSYTDGCVSVNYNGQTSSCHLIISSSLDISQKKATVGWSLYTKIAPCPDGWALFQSSCYLLELKMMTWSAAMTNCGSYDSHLAYVETGQEMTFLKEIIQESGRINIPYYFGGTDADDENNWRWLNGDPFTYTEWSQGQPDNYNALEHYLEYQPWDAWNDGSGLFPNYSVCEKTAL